MAVDDDVGPVQTPLIATLAGVAVMIGSFFSAGAGLQLLLVVKVYGWVQPVPYLLLLLGVAGMATGGMLTRGRTWAAVASALLSGGLALTGLFWVVWAFMYGFFAPLPLLAALLAVGAALLAPFAILPCRTVSAARQKLYE